MKTNSTENTTKPLASQNDRLPYEKPSLEEIEIILEGSFLCSNSNNGDFPERATVDDDEETDEFD